MISKSMVVPNPHGLFPGRPPLDGLDTQSVRVPRAHISDSSPIGFEDGLIELCNPSGA